MTATQQAEIEVLLQQKILVDKQAVLSKARLDERIEAISQSLINSETVQ